MKRMIIENKTLFVVFIIVFLFSILILLNQLLDLILELQMNLKDEPAFTTGAVLGFILVSVGLYYLNRWLFRLSLGVKKGQKIKWT